MKVLYWLRKGKYCSTIYCRIIADKVRAGSGFSTGIEVRNDNWSSKNQEVLVSDPEHPYKNKKLYLIRSNIQRVELELMGAGKSVTSKEIEKVYLGKSKVNYTFYDVLKMYLKHVETQVPAFITRSTADTYASKCKNIKAFLKENDMIDSGLDEIRPVTLDRMRIFFSGPNYQFSYNHVSKHLEIIRQIMRFAIQHELTDSSPLIYLKIKKSPPKPIIYLTEAEILAMAQRLFMTRLSIVRDIFLLQCFTGFSYAELATFLKDPLRYINPGIDDKAWIFIQRGKIKKYQLEYSQPIIKNARIILERYNYKIKIRSNQKYNEYLKEIADLCGINKHLTTHVARKTYGMLLLNGGVPMETVSKLLGHTSIRTTERIYVKITEHKIANDIKRFEKDFKLAI